MQHIISYKQIAKLAFPVIIAQSVVMDTIVAAGNAAPKAEAFAIGQKIAQ